MAATQAESHGVCWVLHLGGEDGVEGAESDGKSYHDRIWDRCHVMLVGLSLARYKLESIRLHLSLRLLAHKYE